ncbi:polysaccharide deacetylase family protein [Hornefia butyriciproducens]|uniref:polysaccharide deacetylase family protein n=1 Tax=Hornefia butyriciproducens TaxID=2652293 RepID=UPI0023F292C0|nr:polysaccharide deacetylase family protein [Hornefia butyriciproducens]MDD6298884.1 polysaccharide deacetylase family protein [Hornefia butyriciproducens]
MTGKKLTLIIVLLFALTIAVGTLGGYRFWQDSRREPVITLAPGNADAGAVHLRYGDRYREPGYTARAGDGRDITGRVKTQVPDMTRVGKYTVRYSVTDSAGHEVSTVRQVTVTWPAQTKAGRKRGLAVLMYHDVYDPKRPPAGLNANMISTTTLEGELKYLVASGYYFPAWNEVREYLDGKIDLPAKSVVLTFDDGTKGFIHHAAPLLERYSVRATSFVICSKNGEAMAKKNYRHIDLESHSYNMHRPGGKIGHGGVMTALSDQERLADLKRSQEILGSRNAFAYPFGDYNDGCRKSVKEAGFRVAFTTAYGKIHPGDDPYLLSRVRVNGNISLETFRKMI